MCYVCSRFDLDVDGRPVGRFIEARRGVADSPRCRRTSPDAIALQKCGQHRGGSLIGADRIAVGGWTGCVTAGQFINHCGVVFAHAFVAEQTVGILLRYCAIAVARVPTDDDGDGSAMEGESDREYSATVSDLQRVYAWALVSAGQCCVQLMHELGWACLSMPLIKKRAWQCHAARRPMVMESGILGSSCRRCVLAPDLCAGGDFADVLDLQDRQYSSGEVCPATDRAGLRCAGRVSWSPAVRGWLALETTPAYVRGPNGGDGFVGCRAPR